MLKIPYTFRSAGLRTPLNRLDANFFALAAWINGRVFSIGPLANRPTAGNPGALYVASDQGYGWYLDDGLAWQPVGGLGQGTLLIDPATGNLVCFFDAPAPTDGRHVWLGKLGVPPTTRPADVAHLYVADKGGEQGRAHWTSLPENGGARPMDPVLFRRVGTTGAAISTSATGETTLGSTTLPANTLIDRSLEVSLRYDVLSPGAARTVTFRVKLGTGPTTLLTCAMNFPAVALANGIYAGQIDALTPSVQRALHTYTTAYPAATSDTLTTADGALDATTALPLTVTAQWSVGGGTLNVYAITVRLI